MAVEPRPGSTVVSAEFELRCDAVHPVHCDEELRAGTRHGVVMLLCDHGAHEHGFTRRWYTARRLAEITRQVERRAR